VRPAPVTVVIPTLNEASQIAECVRSLAWASEVIVVDAASRDDTVAIARAAGATVIAQAAPGIAAQRNAGIAAARNDWVFALDADERIAEPLARELAETVAAPRHDAYRVKRRNQFTAR
jgi:glycosyltransferase involved in cell wall biosynthesis